MGFQDKTSTSPQFSDWGPRKRMGGENRVGGIAPGAAWTYTSRHMQDSPLETLSSQARVRRGRESHFQSATSWPHGLLRRTRFTVRTPAITLSSTVQGANGGGVFWARHTPNLAFGGVTSMALGSSRLAPKGLAKYRYPAVKTGSRGHAESCSHKSRLRGQDFPRLPIGRPYLKQAGRALASLKSSYLARGPQGIWVGKWDLPFGIPALDIWGASIGGRWSW